MSERKTDRFSRLIGTGGYLPQKEVWNKDLPSDLNTSDEWIQQRVGIESRHIAEGVEDAVYMAAQAARQAMKRASVAAHDIDLIIVATCSGPKIFPSTACLVQAELGIENFCPAFDVQAACNGFLYAWHQADLWIQTGQAKMVLVIGSEVMSKVVDWTDRSTCVLFGDGAGAALLCASNQPGILASKLGAHGQVHDMLGLNNPWQSPGFEGRLPHLHMQGNKVFKFAVNQLEGLAKDFLSEQSLDLQSIDWLVPHQANFRIIQTMAHKLGLPLEKVALTLAHHGNTSAASVPLALHTWIERGLIQPGHKVLLEGVGGGMNWGISLFQY